jgi:hypothetical protein
VEPYLVAHPYDPRHLLAAAMVAPAGAEFTSDRQRLACATFLSRDGGARWVRHDFPVTDCGDPWLAISADGRAVFSMLGVTGASRQKELLVFHSPDAGRSWSPAPVSLGPGHDHPALVADHSASERAGWVYLTSTHAYRDAAGRRRQAVFVARSRDAGRTFDHTTRLQPSNLFIFAEVPVVLADGTLVVSYVDTSNDERAPQQRRAWIVRSTDGAEHFSTPEYVTEACGPPRFAPSVLAVDPSPSRRPQPVYHACNRTGGAGVVVTALRDTSERWSPEVVVTDAADTASAAGATTETPRQVRALTVDGDGVVGVVWVRRTGEGDALRCYEAFFAASRDQGRTFAPALPLTGGPTCAGRRADGTVLRSHASGGDYFGLVPAGDGRFHALWSEAPGDGSARLRLQTIGPAAPAPKTP